VALKKLVQRGLVNEIPGEIQRYAIAPPSGAFTPFVQNLKKDLSDQATNLAGLEQVISKLESVHKEKQTLEPDSIQKGEIWVIKGEEEIKRKIGELLLTAKTSVLAVTTEMGLIFLCKGFGKVLDNLVEKGVRVQLKVPVVPSNESFVRELRVTFKVDDVKVLVPVFLLTIDDRELFLASFAADGDQVVFGENRGIFCEEENLVSFFNELLDAQIHRG
jgi:sugar-specific transcriptional regulator TrmB